MKPRRLLCAMLALSFTMALAAGTAAAQPVDKTDAKSLLQSGLKLFAAKDYLGALAVFKDAYARFPSAKILLNIGTTLARLDRNAEAANTYQRYLDDPDSDPAKRKEVVKVLADLDKKVGIVEVSVSPGSAEVQLADGDWTTVSSTQPFRVSPGDVTVHARADGYEPGAQTVKVAAGAKVAVTLAIVPVPVVTTPAPNADDPDRMGVTGEVRARRPPSRYGAIAVAHVDVNHFGGAALVGLAADLTRRIQVQAAAVLGATAGGYAGARYAFLDGKVRPLIAAGVPIFVSNGARFAARGAGGVELVLNRHLSVLVEAGVEHVLNPEDGVVATVFVPALGVTGRL